MTLPYLLLAALITGTFHTWKAPVLSIRRAIGPVVMVEVLVVVVLMVGVEQTGWAAIDGAPFALGRAAAIIEPLAPHAGSKLGALHDPARHHRGWGRTDNDVVTRPSGFPVPVRARDGHR